MKLQLQLIPYPGSCLQELIFVFLMAKSNMFRKLTVPWQSLYLFVSATFDMENDIQFSWSVVYLVSRVRNKKKTYDSSVLMPVFVKPICCELLSYIYFLLVRCTRNCRLVVGSLPRDVRLLMRVA